MLRSDILGLLALVEETHAGGEVYIRAVGNANMSANGVTAAAGDALRKDVSKCLGLGLVETYQEAGNIHDSFRAYSLVCLRNPFHADYVVTGGFVCDYDANATWAEHTKRCADDQTASLFLTFVEPDDFWDQKKFSVAPYKMKFQLRHFTIGTGCTLRADGSQMAWGCERVDSSGGTLVLTTSSNERLKPLSEIAELRDYADAFTADISGAQGVCKIGY